MTRRMIVALVVSAAVMTGGACGGEVAAPSQAFCQAKAALDAVSPDTPDEPALQRYQSETAPLFASLIDAAPGELRDDARAWRDSIADPANLEAAAAAVEDPAVAKAKEAIAVKVHRGCDFPRVEFKTADNRFTAAPDRVRAGKVSILLENDGKKIHAVILFRLNDGVTASEGKALAGSDELETKATFVNAFPAAADAAAGLVTELLPGRYLYFDDEHPKEMRGTFQVV